MNTGCWRKEMKKTGSITNETFKTHITNYWIICDKGINLLGTQWVCRNLLGKYNSTNKSGYKTYTVWTQTGKLKCKHKGRRNTGWPKKRWKEQLYLQGQGTDTTANPSEFMMIMMTIIMRMIRSTITWEYVALIVAPNRSFLRSYRDLLSHERDDGWLPSASRWLCRGAVRFTRYTSKSDTPPFGSSHATRNSQSNGM